MRKTFLRRVCSVFMVLSFVLTQSGGVVPGLGYGVVKAAADTSILDGRILFAQSLHNAAAEGTAKTNLQTAINDAKSVKNNYSENQEVIDSAVITLNNAITVFQESIITDADGDGVSDDTDNCPLSNADQLDADGDGVGDACDNCQTVSNADQKDLNENGIGDVCESTEESDTTDPVITLLGVSPVSVFVGSVYEDAGATAADDTDGDLTEVIDIVSTVNTEVIGNYTVTYEVMDSAGNGSAPVIRVVNVIEEEEEDEEEGEEDTINPVITILGNNPINIYVGDVYEDAGATAADDTDGDLTEVIDIVSNVNTAIAGNYTVSYEVSDAAGNGGTAIRNVNVIARENSNGGGAAIIIAKFAPLNASIVINSGNEKTAIRNVALALSAENAEMMAIANDSGFAGSSWEIYTPSKEWTLTEGDGVKTVYAKFKNASGTESKVYTDEIILGGNGSDDNGSVLGDDTVGIYNGDLIQCKTSADPGAVYVVKIVGNKKFIRHIKSDFFKSYKDIVWSDVKEVASLDEYTVSKWVRINTGMNGTAKPTDKVYEINDDWTKHWLNMTTDQFFASGGSEEAIFSINQGELDSYTAGADVL